MFEINEDFLHEVGLGAMPAEQKTSFLEYLRETLEMHIGLRLVDGVDQGLLDQFEELIELRNEEGALAWLKNNCPGYTDIVKDELTKLRNEVIASRDDILGAAV